MMNTAHMHTSRPWESTKTCSSSEGIRCCTLTLAWYTFKCRHCNTLWGWVGVFVWFSTPFDISWWEGGEGGAGVCKWNPGRVNNCKSERERKSEDRDRWVESFLGWWEAKNLPPVSPLLPWIRVWSRYELLSTCVSLPLFIYCTVDKKQWRVTSWMKRRYSLTFPCYYKYERNNSANETTLRTLRPCNSIL